MILINFIMRFKFIRENKRFSRKIRGKKHKYFCLHYCC